MASTTGAIGRRKLKCTVNILESDVNNLKVKIEVDVSLEVHMDMSLDLSALSLDKCLKPNDPKMRSEHVPCQEMQQLCLCP